MIISYKWLQTYFEEKLPEPEQLADLISLRAFEIESVEENGEDFKIDIKILPDRAHDCLCHDGIAREVSAITGIPMKKRNIEVVAGDFKSDLKVAIHDSACRRYMSREIKNVVVDESPVELKEKLESIGQRSINTIVDITNIVMYTMGQPMHAFDADKISGVEINVRMARTGEKIKTLDNKDVELDETVLLIADASEPLAIAGIKGGKKAEVDKATKNIILESANFHPTGNRKTARKIGITTDSSKRYENEISPEIADRAMDMATELILKYAKSDATTVSEKIDCYPKKWRAYNTGVSVDETNNLLGLNYTESNIARVFDLLGFNCEVVSVTERVAEEAKKLVGAKYKYAASVFFDAPTAFDCSSFISYVYALAGYTIPRMAVDQFVFSERITADELSVGDLVFSNTGELKRKIDYKSVEFLKGTEIPSGVDHVGIYLGDGQIIHATELNGAGVVIENLNESARFKNIVGYGRLAKQGEKRFAVTVPVERVDIKNSPDLIDEIARILGYENIKEKPIESFAFNPNQNKMYALSAMIRNVLVDHGFSEVMTYTFVSEGELQPEKPISEDKGYLRATLEIGMRNALEKNMKNADLLGLDQIRIFEIGKVFSKKGERNILAIGAVIKNASKKQKVGDILREAVTAVSEKIGQEISAKISDTTDVIEIDLEKIVNAVESVGYEKLPPVVGEQKYKIISQYPFMVRDIAVWVPDEVSESAVLDLIVKNAGNLMVRNRLFDVYKKDGRTSFAFRLVFQSMEKTLTDDEANSVMEKISGEMKGQGWEVR